MAKGEIRRFAWQGAPEPAEQAIGGEATLLHARGAISRFQGPETGLFEAI